MRSYYRLLYLISNIIFRFLFRYKVFGRENVPKKGSLLILANHASNLDPPLIGAGIEREIFFLAKAELFKYKFVSRILTSLNAFPIKRGAIDRRALNNCLKILKDKGALLMFPEGRRTINGEIKKGQPGSGMIILKAKKKYNTTIIPAYIEGSYEALPRGKIMIKFSPIRIFFGRSIKFPKEILNSLNRENYQKAIDIVMEEIKKLGKKNENYCC